MILLRHLRHLYGKHLLVLLTRDCNLDCGYCKVKDQPFKDADLDAWKKEIDHFNRFAITKVIISGGEPTLYPHLFEFLDYLHQNSFATTSLVTNGVKLRNDPMFLAQLAEAKLDKLIVSLNSPQELDLLQKLSPQFPLLVVKTMVTKENLAQIPAMLGQIAKYHNVYQDLVLVQTEENFFSTQENEKLLPSPEKAHWLANRLVKMKLMGYPLLTSFSYLNHLRDYAQGWRWKCDRRAFKTFFALNNDARIMVCPATRPLDFRLSEINADNLSNVRKEINSVTAQCKGCLFTQSYESSLNRLLKYADLIPLTPRIIRNFRL